MLNDIFDYMVILFAGPLIEKGGMFEVQSLEHIRSAVDGWKALSESEIAHKTHRVVMGVLSSGLLSLMGIPFTEDGFLTYLMMKNPKIRFNSVNDMAISICELSLSFVEIGYECFVEKSLQPVLCRDRHCRNWIMEYQELVKQIERAPVNPDFNPDETLGAVDSLLSRGVHLMSNKNNLLKMFWQDLSAKRSSLLASYSIANTRKPPFSLLIYGPPGIGKTTIMNVLATFYHRCVVDCGVYPDLKFDPQKNIYTRNPDDEYFSGYNGAMHDTIFIDDIAKESPNQIKNGMKSSLKDVITIVNSVGVCTNQAELSKKGTVPLLPKLVIASTNTKNLNAHLAVSEPTALLRRFPLIITPHLKEEYLDKETGTMKKLDELVHDAWTFTVERYKIQPGIDGSKYNVVGVYTTIFESCSMGELQSFLYSEIQRHEKSSEVMMQGMDTSDEVLCDHKCLTRYCQQCNLQMVPQAGIRDFFFPPPLSYSQRVKAALLYAAVRYAPYSVYQRIVACFNPSSKEMMAAAAHRYRDSVPSKARLAQYAFFSLLSYSFLIFFANMIGNILGEKLVPQSKVEKSNIWVESDFKKNDDFSLPIRAKRGNLEELKNSVIRSLVRLTVQNGASNGEVTAFYIGESCFVTVGHIFRPQREWKCAVTFGRRQGGANPVYPFILHESQVKRLPNDLVIFQSNAIVPRKSLYEFLPEKVDTCGRDCISLNVVEGILETGIVETTGMRHHKHPDDYGGYVEGTFMGGRRIDRMPRRGDCGSIVLSCANGRYFVSGIHCAGAVGTGLFSSSYPLLLTQVSKENLPRPPRMCTISEMGDDSLLRKGSRSSGPLGEPFRKGIHHWSETHSECLGSYPGRVRSTSSVQPTMIKDDIEEAFNMKLPYGPPLMVPKQKEDGEWINPFTISAVAQGNITGAFSEVDVEYVAGAYVNDLFARTKWLKDTGPVSLDVAVNGIEGDPWVNRLPMSTSGGFYFPGRKDKYFDKINENTYVPHPEVLEMVTAIENAYKMGERANVIFNATLKDEPTKQSKIDSGKTRVFTACDVAFSIVVRRQYLKVTKAFMTNNFVTECAVGMNAYSEDWERLYKYLTRFGNDRIIAGDYSNYDKNMPAIFIRYAFHVLDQCRTRLRSISRADYLIGQGIATDISYPITNMNGDVFQFTGGNSSGHPLTVIINSIVNSLYVRYVYMKRGLNVATFRHNVTLMTLGDDNIMGSRLDDFNHTVIQQELGKRGVPYTMSDKETASEKFINISRADFLKRRFVKNEYRIVGPLELKSVFKSLCYYVVKHNISNYEQIAQTYLSARREWSLHGREVFDNCVNKMEKIFDDPKNVRIRDFFISKHYLNYDDTLAWVLELDTDEE